jgi:hypothetical protein
MTGAGRARVRPAPLLTRRRAAAEKGLFHETQWFRPAERRFYSD